MLRAVLAEREALDVGGEFLNDGVERFMAADLLGSGGPVAAIDGSRLFSGRSARQRSRRVCGDVDLKLLSGPTDDAFARGRLIEVPTMRTTAVMT
jgi:hypothetical protein